VPFTQNLAATLVKQPRKGLAQILPADTTSQKTVVTAGANGSKVVSLIASSSDTTDRVVQVFLVRSATSYLLCTLTVPLTAGFAAAVPGPVNLLGFVPNLPVDNDGQPYLFLESGDTLTVASLTTVTTAKAISVHSDYGDF
jgi:hypothetical protein